MSVDYKNGLTDLQSLALDIMFRCGEGSTEAIISAKEILGVKVCPADFEAKSSPTTAYSYLLFVSDFEDGCSVVHKVSRLSELSEKYVEESVAKELILAGCYYGAWCTFHLVKVKE